MSVIIPDNLPAIELLQEEHIRVYGQSETIRHHFAPLRVALLNLMPLKISTEADYIRLLSNSPLWVELTFMKLRSHTSKNTPLVHLNRFYRFFDELKNQHFDGLIITGAPVELIPFEEVDYWQELIEVFDWAHEQIPSALYICWASQAALYHFHHIPKYRLDKKMFGIFPHRLDVEGVPIFHGFDDVFYVPHSRYTEIRKEDVLKVKALTLLAESEESGVYMATARKGREFFITGHSEYEPLRLDMEYQRDLNRGLPTEVPQHYYVDDDPVKRPLVRWRAHSNLLFTNWLNYYVSQQIAYQ
ncbi:homoserine O-succinyltransferase [Phocaeicola abscessus]|uniref:homoserine O-succinyltransferase n=1 Tax=Phocaeicola abscessus TaxID=555313 RepID=UPI0004AF7D53|nr:homoserine O-succinyltransferase [Phocaeicola abscessus]